MAAWNEAQAAEILRGTRAATAILPDVLTTFGHVPAEAVPFVARSLYLSRVQRL